MVGKKRKEYQVHVALLCDGSKFFKEYFEKPHADKLNVYEPLVDVPAFEVFLNWLYSGRLNVPFAPDNQSIRPYLNLYFLSVKFQNETLSNSILDGIRLFYRDADSLPLDDVVFVYSHTKAGDPLRMFMVTGWTFDVLQDEENGIAVIYSDRVGMVLANGGALAIDLYREMMDRAVRHHDNGDGDDRLNPYLMSFPFTFHNHVETPRCVACVGKEDL